VLVAVAHHDLAALQRGQHDRLHVLAAILEEQLEHLLRRRLEFAARPGAVAPAERTVGRLARRHHAVSLLLEPRGQTTRLLALARAVDALEHQELAARLHRVSLPDRMPDRGLPDGECARLTPFIVRLSPFPIRHGLPGIPGPVRGMSVLPEALGEQRACHVQVRERESARALL